MYKLAKELWPINRSLTGEGVEKTLSIIKKNLPIKILNFKSGSKAFDWKIPKVWEIKNGWLKNEKNEKILDFKKNNLHVVGYSKYVNKDLTLKKLKKRIHYLKNNMRVQIRSHLVYLVTLGFLVSYLIVGHLYLPH